VKASASILPGILAGIDILCLRVAVVMFAVKHHRLESSTDRHERGYETDLGVIFAKQLIFIPIWILMTTRRRRTWHGYWA
jgi:hypothetical protein